MARRFIGLLLLGVLFLTLVPASASAGCGEAQVSDDCCCPGMKQKGHCDKPSRQIDSARACCGPVVPPALPAGGGMEQSQAKKTVAGPAAFDLVTPLPSASGASVPATRDGPGPPAVPLYRLHASLLI